MESSDDEYNDPCLDLLTKPLGNRPLRKYKIPIPFSLQKSKPIDDKMMNPPSMVSNDYICDEGDTTIGKSNLLMNNLSRSRHTSRSATPTAKHVSKDIGHWYDQYVREEERLYMTQRSQDNATESDLRSLPGTLSAIETNTISTSILTQRNNEGNMTMNSNTRSLFDSGSRQYVKEFTDLMKRFNFHTRNEELDLPISRNREKILDLINNNKVTIIHGYTGSGKTTQVPQFILDHYAEKKKHVNIIVTQPRKIAAQSVARRVCQERKWQLGGLVGYVVGLDKGNQSPDTRLLFCTTGVLKKMLISKKHANDYTHVIIDEVHEREEDVDFILMLLRRLINTNSRNVRIILMSATINVNSFKDYFSLGQTKEPEVFELHDSNPYHVAINYLEDIRSNREISFSFTGWNELYDSLDSQTPHLSEAAIKLAALCIQKFDDYEKIQQVKERAAVLVFLPGENEIKQVKREFEQRNKKDWWILPLHSKISWDETKLVFEKPPEGFRKIILSTNIAESSLTISDVDYVIDFCLTKLVTADPETNYFSLRLSWTDKNSCEQRKGRAGRLRSGKCFRMVRKTFYDRYLPNQSTPEILRAPLDKVILDTKMLDFAPPLEILALTMAPPKKSDIMKNVMLLKEMGALLPTVATSPKPVVSMEDGDLTVLGRLAGSLPVDVRLGKFIILGHLFDVLDECVIIAAGLSNKTIFASSFDKQIEAFSDRLYWSNGSSSDCIAVLMAYKTWKLKRENQYFLGSSLRESRKTEEHWCTSRHLQLKHLKEMDLKIAEIYDDLKKRCKIEQLTLPNRDDRRQKMTQGIGGHYFMNEDSYIRIMCAMFGAFYPNYFLRSHIERDQNDIAKTLHGKDVGTTFYLTGFPQSQHENCILYEEQIKDLFRGTGCCSESIEVEFVSGQFLKGEGFTKVLITFLPENQDLYRELETLKKDYTIGLFGNNTISPYIYTGMKLRSMPKDFLRLNLYNDTEAHEKKLALKQRMKKEAEFTRTSAKTIGIIKPPPPEQKMADFSVSHVTTPNSFWVNYVPEIESEGPQVLLKNAISDIIQLKHDGYNGLRTKNPKIGQVYLAPYIQGNYYRARVDQKDDCEETVTVFFIDFGNVKIGVGYSELIDFNELSIDTTIKDSVLFNVPALAMECSLARTKPNPMRLLSTDNTWDTEVNEKFKEYLQEQVSGEGEMPYIYAEIFSIINRQGKNGPLLNVIVFPTNDMAEQSFANSNSTFTDEFGCLKVGGFRFEDSLNYRLQQERDKRGRKLALMAEEKYTSKISHEDRARIQTECTFSDRSYTFADSDSTFDSKRKIQLDVESDDKVLDEYFYGNEEDGQSLNNLKSNGNAILQAELRGPNHPLEFTLQAVHRLGRRKYIRIEPDSVNSILLDKSLPDEKHDQWLVAHEVAVNSTSSNLLLRSTNFMPNRAGLGYILAMVFSPSVELRPKANCNYYTGCLIGMGSRERIDDQQNFFSNETFLTEKVPYYPEHDMELTFDVKITNEDVENINELRYAISHALTLPFRNAHHDAKLNSNPSKAQSDLPRLAVRKHLIEDQDKISNLLNKLIGKHVRDFTTKESYIHPYHWLEQPPKGFSSWQKPELENENELIFKMIPFTCMTEDEDKFETASSLFKTMSEGESTSDRFQYLRKLEGFSSSDKEVEREATTKSGTDQKHCRKNFHRLKIGGVHTNI